MNKPKGKTILLIIKRLTLNALNISEMRYTLLIFTVFFNFSAFGQARISVNQLGYLPGTAKIAVLISVDPLTISNFNIINSSSGEMVLQLNSLKDCGPFDRFKSSYRLDFSEFDQEGSYFLEAGGISSPFFCISKGIYDGAADFLLNYMRQQRCGFNPLLMDSCHTHDGYVIYNEAVDSAHIDVTGGWHDASDYLQYVTTSANAVFQMLFAYQQNPGSFGDRYLASGTPGVNGIPDILDEAKWGLDWLIRMNPEPEVMYNQVADDRDHMSMRLPTKDSVSYGKGLERPVYLCTGKPQGIFQHRNRTTGIASTAAKYASAFALGSRLLNPFYPDLARVLEQKAIDAYSYGSSNPGVCQTAPCRAPYFYEEENWTDDMELAAIQLNILTGNEQYLEEAVVHGRFEKVTPWMGADTARHYQWYPFVNLGHFYLSIHGNDSVRKEFTFYIRQGIEAVRNRTGGNPFLFGVPYIWCSNNLVSAMLTQIRLYEELTGSRAYEEMEAALRDWLFGCNPWGTSMIVGLPGNGDYPGDTHAAISWLNIAEPLGGLVDGPVYGSIYNNLRGIYLANPDEYAPFQPSGFVYHDDYADYSTNEPTMDGTASLTYYFGSLVKSKHN